MSLLEYLLLLLWSACVAIYYSLLLAAIVCAHSNIQSSKTLSMQAKAERKNLIALIVDSLSNEDHQSIFLPSAFCLFNAFIIVCFHLYFCCLNQSVGDRANRQK